MAEFIVSVDHNYCVGSTLCMAFLPSVFELNAEGQSVVVNLDGITELELVQTAEQCPQCAIRVARAEDGEVLFPPPELQR